MKSKNQNGNNNKTKKPKPKTSSSKNKNTSLRKRGSKREIVFDPEARRNHLRGFSERKRQRRAFGLAMQRVKDRNEKLEQRKKEKQDILEQVEEAERNKEALLRVTRGEDDSEPNDNDSDSDSDEADSSAMKDALEKSAGHETKTYDDEQTEQKWGGQVVVTTSEIQLDGDSDEEEREERNRKKKNVDVQQKYAGNVERFMNELKGNMPGKKRDGRAGPAKRKGKNGAADMKGMGGAANLKLAQKALAKSQAKMKAPSWQKGGKKAGKKGKR